MTAYEIPLAESQERMLMVVALEQEEAVHEIFARWGLNSATIGRGVTADCILRIWKNGAVVAEVPADSLTEEAPVSHPASRQTGLFRNDLRSGSGANTLMSPMLTKPCLSLLAVPSISSKERVWQQYDYLACTRTVVRPGSDAAVLRIRGTKRVGSHLFTDCELPVCHI